MPIIQLDTENADRNITSTITVLTDTPHAAAPTVCAGLIMLGDGTKNLDGTGGTFEFVVTVGGQTVQPSPQNIVFGTEVRSSVWTTPFPVPANTEVILRVKSPNAADSDVDVTAYLYDLFPVNPGLAQTNVRWSSITYDANNQLTAVTIASYPTAADTEAETNAIDSVTLTATYNASGEITGYKIKKN